MPVPAGGDLVADPDMLATVDDLELLLKRDLNEDSATLVLQACTAVVQATAGQRIIRVVDDEQVIDLDVYDRGVHLELPERPVVAVAAVQVGDTAVTDYQPQLSRGRLWRSMGWRSATLPYYDSPSTVTVTYTHGLEESDQRIQLARGTCLSLAAALYENPTGATNERIDDYAVAYAAASAQMAASDALATLLRRRYGRPGRSVRLVSVGDS